MKKRKLFAALILFVAIALLFCACSQDTSSEDPQNNADMAEESKDIFDQMQDIAATNSAVSVGEYATPDESCFVTEPIDGGVAVCSYLGDLKAIEIPDTINGEKVLAINSGAFSDTAVTGVRIPDSVTQIKEKAFYYCMTLVEVELGSGVQEIGYEAFEGCLALRSVKLNQGLRRIGSMVFSNTPSLGEIILPESLESTGEGVFVLSGIHELTIPGNVKTIERQVCSTCTNLEHVIIADGVETIKNKAFESCKALLTVEIPASVQEIESLTFMYTDQVTIVAPAGSTAEAFARDNELAFSAQ